MTVATPTATTPAGVIVPIIIAVILIAICSLLREPVRQRFSAIFVAGAGAAFLYGRIRWLGTYLLRRYDRPRLSWAGRLSGHRCRLAPPPRVGSHTGSIRNPDHLVRARLLVWMLRARPRGRALVPGGRF